MCGKFTQYASWEQVHAFSQPLTASPPGEIVAATPMQFARIMRLDPAGKRELVPMRWGFAGKDDASPARPKHIHARSETIDTRQTFAAAFAQSRGILMVHTFNEGEKLPSGKTRQWTIAPKDGKPIAMAVLYEQWRNGPETLDTFVLVTTPANALIAQITDRMPAILPPETWAAWLGETDAALPEIKQLLQTFQDDGTWTMAPQSSSARRSNLQQELF